MALFDPKDDDLGHIVGMQCHERFLKLIEPGMAGLDKQQDLLGVLYFSLPTIDRSNARQEIDAGGKSGINKLSSDLLGGLSIRAGAQDELYCCHTDPKIVEEFLRRKAGQSS